MCMGYESYGLAAGLEEFMAVARHEHITRAARDLGVHQPTLSRAIARLSAQLGVELVERDGRGVRLTRPGRLLADRAERALAELLAGVDAARAEADPEGGTVVLGFLHSMGPTVIPDLLRAFRARRPGVTVRLVHDGTDELLRLLLDGQVDLCLAAPETRRLPPEIGSRTLAEQRLVLLVRTGHQLAEQTPVQLGDLGDEPLIAMKPAYGLRPLTDDLLKAAHVTGAYAFESQDIATACGLVAAGLGVALLPAGSGVAGTVELPLSAPGATRAISLAWRHRPATAPLIELRQHIIDAAPRLLVPEAAQA